MNLRALQEGAAKKLLARRLCQAVLAGEMKKVEYSNYMSDVYCYAAHSSQVIAIAGSRLTLTHPNMAEYLYRHAAEELGHDKWARSDLIDLGIAIDAIESLRPSSACLNMIGLEYFFAAYANPVGLFGWMFVLESLGGSIGGSLAKAVDKTLHLNGKGMYFLNGHAEADIHHSEELFDVINENLTDKKDEEVFLRMYDESLAAYCKILDSAYVEERIAA